LQLKPKGKSLKTKAKTSISAIAQTAFSADRAISINDSAKDCFVVPPRKDDFLSLTLEKSSL